MRLEHFSHFVHFLFVKQKQGAQRITYDTTYGGDQENGDEDIGDLAPEDLVPLYTSITLEGVEAIGLESFSGLFGGETFEDRGLVVFGDLFDGEGVEGSLWLDVDGLFSHNLLTSGGVVFFLKVVVRMKRGLFVGVVVDLMIGGGEKKTSWKGNERIRALSVNV